MFQTAKICTIAAAILFSFTQQGFSQPAIGSGIEITPTVVEIGPRAQSSTIYVRNTGNQEVTFRVDLGAAVPVGDGRTQFTEDPGSIDEGSAAPMLVHSPRQVTVSPGEMQTIRVAVRRPEDLEAGEYTARLRARALPQPDSAQAVIADNDSGVRMRVQPVMNVSIPIFLQND